MRLTLTAILLLGCSGAPKIGDSPLDASAAIDLALPDLAPTACTLPRPGIYEEDVTYSYQTTTGNVLMVSRSTVVVRNSGKIDRPASAIFDPSRFHCMFSEIDAESCTAPCCPGQPASPVMYFDAGGWTLWMGGSCQFQTTSAANYLATITDVEGIFSR